VVDLIGMRQTSSDEILEKFGRSQVFDSIDTWDATSANFFQDTLRNESTLGSPYLIDTDSDIEYSRFNASIEVERDVLSFVIKNLLPLFAIIILAYLAAFLPPAQFAINNAILRGALLTVAFFHIKLSNDLPGIGYTVALDYVFYMMYALIVLLLVLTLLSHRANQKDDTTKATIYSLIGRVIYPAIILLGVFFFANRFDLFTYLKTQLVTKPTTFASEMIDEGIAALTEDQEEVVEEQEVVLTLGSWRTEDDEHMKRILDAFNSKHPNITVKFSPAVSYRSTLTFQLESGIAPDMFYLPSYGFSRTLFDEGYLEVLGDISSLQNIFPVSSLLAWATEDQEVYGVPFIAVSHAIYYNKDMFDQLGLSIPRTWKDLLIVAEDIKDAGYIPIANATGQQGAFAEEVFMNLAPNFIGGRDGRLEYVSGLRCFNDEYAVAAFQAIADLAPFLPKDGASLRSNDSKHLFLGGEAAMIFGGSWDVTYFEAEEPDFEWGIFAVPAPARQPEYVSFHPDAAIGLNAASPHADETRVFFEWLVSREAADLLQNELPGFFSMQKDPPSVQNEHANSFLNLNKVRDTDVRWAYPVLMDGLPSGHALMRENVAAVAQGEMTPQEAADALPGRRGSFLPLPPQNRT